MDLPEETDEGHFNRHFIEETPQLTGSTARWR